jgi:hypothetical protein
MNLKEIGINTRESFQRVKAAWSTYFNRIFGETIEAFGPFIETGKALLSWLKRMGEMLWRGLSGIYKARKAKKAEAAAEEAAEAAAALEKPTKKIEDYTSKMYKLMNAQTKYQYHILKSGLKYKWGAISAKAAGKIEYRGGEDIASSIATTIFGKKKKEKEKEESPEIQTGPGSPSDMYKLFGMFGKEKSKKVKKETILTEDQPPTSGKMSKWAKFWTFEWAVKKRLDKKKDGYSPKVMNKWFGMTKGKEGARGGVLSKGKGILGGLFGGSGFLAKILTFLPFLKIMLVTGLGLLVAKLISTFDWQAIKDKFFEIGKKIGDMILSPEQWDKFFYLITNPSVLLEKVTTKILEWGKKIGDTLFTPEQWDSFFDLVTNPSVLLEKVTTKILEWGKKIGDTLFTPEQWDSFFDLVTNPKKLLEVITTKILDVGKSIGDSLMSEKEWDNLFDTIFKPIDYIKGKYEAFVNKIKEAGAAVAEFFGFKGGTTPVKTPSTPPPPHPSPPSSPVKTPEVVKTVVSPVKPIIQAGGKSIKKKKGVGIDKETQVLINKTAEKYGMSARDLTAFVQLESGGREDVISPTGAKGLMQLLPGAAKDVGANFSELLNPEKNLDAGAKYFIKVRNELKQKLKRDPSLDEIYLAYNQGVKGSSEIIKVAEGQGVLSSSRRRAIDVNLPESMKGAGADTFMKVQKEKVMTAYALADKYVNENGQKIREAEKNTLIAKNESSQGTPFVPQTQQQPSSVTLASPTVANVNNSSGYDSSDYHFGKYMDAMGFASIYYNLGLT